MVSIQEIARLPYFPTLCRRMEKLSEYRQRLATTYAVCLACVPMTTFTSIAATYFRLELQWLLTHTDPCRAIARRSECFCCCYCKCSWQKKSPICNFAGTSTPPYWQFVTNLRSAVDFSGVILIYWLTARYRKLPPSMIDIRLPIPGLDPDNLWWVHLLKRTRKYYNCCRLALDFIRICTPSSTDCAARCGWNRLHFLQW